MEAKILIVSVILIFTIASIIYSLSLKPSFKTSAQMGIGYFELDNGDRKLIESASDLISNLNIYQLLNAQDREASFKAIENKLLTTMAKIKNRHKLIGILSSLQ